MNEENELNLKILNISLQIKLHNPELLSFLDEMTITIPNEKHPKIDLEVLTAYLDSLIHIWERYLSSHRKK